MASPSWGFANFTGSGICKCIKSCEEMINGYESQAVVGNCVEACSADGTDGTTVNKLSSDGKTCTDVCLAGLLNFRFLY